MTVPVRIRFLSALCGIAVIGAMRAGEIPAEDGYGTLTGQFVLEGEVPQPELIVAQGDPKVKDGEVCAAEDLYSQNLVVDKNSKGIANVFVFMRRAPRNVHPQLKESVEKEVVFDQKGCAFIPHALIVRTDQEVLVKSDDPVPHNTHTYPIRNDAVNFFVRPNDRVGVPVEHNVAEILPIEVKCDFHPHMRALWLIVDHPYAAVTDKDGKFTIERIPAGEHEFRLWHKGTGWVLQDEEGKPQPSIKVTVESNKTTDAGTFSVPVERFEE